MDKYYPPKFKEEQFHCIKCGVYARQEWGYLFSHPVKCVNDLDYSLCSHCNGACYWHEERMIVPSSAPVPPPHSDLPETCIADYEEARDIVARSPKAAAALMRVVLQELMKELGEKGEKINDDIASLVKKGLPVEIQQALDYCRVVGNNSVHPGEIMIDDNLEIAYSLFEMINFIVEDRISRPKNIADLYNKVLPEEAQKAIEKRDSPKKGT